MKTPEVFPLPLTLEELDWLTDFVGETPQGERISDSVFAKCRELQTALEALREFPAESDEEVIPL